MPDPLQQFRDAVETADDTRAEEAVVALTAAGEDSLPYLRRMVRDADPDRRWWTRTSTFGPAPCWPYPT